MGRQGGAGREARAGSRELGAGVGSLWGEAAAKTAGWAGRMGFLDRAPG